MLALARSGAADAAQQRFADYGLHAEATHDEDVAALEARIAKDLALGADHVVSPRPAAQAAALYEAIYARTGGYYTGINAATLRLLSGDEAAARRLATAVLDHIPDDGSYYAAATEAEAHLLLGDESAAAVALQLAADVNAGDYAALATTRQQLQLVCDRMGVDRAALAPLRGPTVLHFCGHRIAPAGAHGRFDAEDAPLLAEKIRQVVTEHRVGHGCGALASGADILCAEALIDAGAQLCVVLPYERDEFVQESVVPAGGDWVARFERCIEAASRVAFATEDAYLDDAVLYRYGTELAMGLASRVRLLGSGRSEKNDPNDARSVAIAALRASELVPVRVEDHATVLRLLASHNAQLGSAYNKTACRLHALVAELVPGGIGKALVVSQARSLLEDYQPVGAVACERHALAVEMLDELERLNTQRKALRKRRPSDETTDQQHDLPTPHRRHRPAELKRSGRATRDDSSHPAWPAEPP